MPSTSSDMAPEAIRIIADRLNYGDGTGHVEEEDLKAHDATSGRWQVKLFAGDVEVIRRKLRKMKDLLKVLGVWKIWKPCWQKFEVQTIFFQTWHGGAFRRKRPKHLELFTSDLSGLTSNVQ